MNLSQNNPLAAINAYNEQVWTKRQEKIDAMMREKPWLITVAMMRAKERNFHISFATSDSERRILMQRTPTFEDDLENIGRELAVYQRELAQKPRKKTPGGVPITQIFFQFFKENDDIEKSSKILWREFFNELASHELCPQKHRDTGAYEYRGADGPQRLTYKRFANLRSKARKYHASS